MAKATSTDNLCGRLMAWGVNAVHELMHPERG